MLPEERRRAHKRVIALAGRAVDATSAYLFLVGTLSATPTLIASYRAATIGQREQNADLAEIDGEAISPNLRTWLSYPTPPPRELHREELGRDTPARNLFDRYDVHSVLLIAIHSQGGAVWGLATFWESRYARNFTDAEIDRVRAVLKHLPL